MGEAAGLRRYAEALVLFLYGLTAPSMVLNAITMASYQKYILVSLIHTGAAPAPCIPRAPLLTHSSILLCKHCWSLLTAMAWHVKSPRLSLDPAACAAG